jgi:chromate reductase, NAD(P)H dehydrogenase (quinone)
MKLTVISGTDRPGSNTKIIAKFLENKYRQLGATADLLDLEGMFEGAGNGPQYGVVPTHPKIKQGYEMVLASNGLVIVTPEYNGSMPGALKYFIDHLKFPDSFENRPVCFVGIGWRFGGLRPVEHLQQIFGYRNAFIYPHRVFLINGPKMIENQTLIDKSTLELLDNQSIGFVKFVNALDAAKLTSLTQEKI